MQDPSIDFTEVTTDNYSFYFWLCGLSAESSCVVVDVVDVHDVGSVYGKAYGNDSTSTRLESTRLDSLDNFGSHRKINDVIFGTIFFRSNSNRAERMNRLGDQSCVQFESGVAPRKR